MSETTRTVGRNVAIQVAGRAGAAGLGLALTATLARLLDLDDFGSLTTAVAVLGMLAVVHEFGAGPIAVRSIARDPGEADVLLGPWVAGRLAAAPVLAALGALALIGTGESGSFPIWAGGVFAVALAGRSLESVDVVLQVAQRMGRSVLASLSGRLAHLLAVLGLAVAGVRRPGPVLAAAAVGVAVSASMRLVLVWPWHRLRIRLAPGRLGAFLREATPTGIAAVLMAVYLNVDAPIVRGLRGAREAALYNAPYRLFLLGAALGGMVMISAAPILAARFREDRRAFARGVRKLLVLSVAAAVPIAVLVALTARPLLGFLFGAGFEAGAGTLTLLAFAAAATGPGTVVTSALIAADRAGWTARLAAVALAGNVGLDLWLVPIMGGEGAAVATLATEGFVAVAGAVVLAGHLRGDR